MSFKQTLNGIFGKNAVKKALIWVLVVAVAVLVIVTQFAFPVQVQYLHTKLYSYSGDKFNLMVKSVYDKLSDSSIEKDITSTSTLLSDTEFDMTNSEDYLRVELAFEFTNIGMYKISNIQFKIEEIPKYKDAFVLKETNVAQIDRFNKSNVSMFIVINRSGLTEEQVSEAVSSLKVSYSFDRPELFSSGGEIELPVITLAYDNVITA